MKSEHPTFTTELDAATYGLQQAADLKSPNEVAGFVVRKSGKFQITRLVQSPVRDEVDTGTVPALATAVFHTHVNDQVQLSIGDEKYARTHRLNIYMYNTKFQASDFREWQECEAGFQPLNISP